MSANLKIVLRFKRFFYIFLKIVLNFDALGNLKSLKLVVQIHPATTLYIM